MPSVAHCQGGKGLAALGAGRTAPNLKSPEPCRNTELTPAVTRLRSQHAAAWEMVLGQQQGSRLKVV